MKLTEQQKFALAKRIADTYEKLGVAGLAVGLFQDVTLGQIVGLLCIAVSLLITYLLEK